MSRSTIRVRATARRRAVAVLGAGLAAAAFGTSCAAGQIAETSQIVPTVDGAQGTVGSIALRNVRIDYPASGSYHSGEDARLTLVLVNQGGTEDTLVGVRSDVATGVTVRAGTLAPGPATALSTPTAGPVTQTSASPSPSASETPSGSASATPSGSVSPSGSASPTGSASESPSGSSGSASSGTVEALALPANRSILAYADGATITLTGLTRDLRPTTPVKVTFTFRRAGQITLTVPVAAAQSAVPQPPAEQISPTEGG